MPKANQMWRRLRGLELLQMLVVGSVAGPVLIFAALVWITWHNDMAEASRDLVWTSEVGVEHANKVFDSFRLVAERVNDVVDADYAGPTSERLIFGKLNDVVRRLPQVESLIVLNRDAHAIVATAAFPVDRSVDFSDRDYFGVLERREQPSYISSVQFSRISGKQFFGWGVSRQTKNGEFNGVIDIAISPRFFMRFYETLISKFSSEIDGRVVTMIREDGQILVRFPGFEGAPAKISPDNPFFAAVKQSPDGGTYTNRSVIDAGAPERLFAFSKVPGHPIFIVAGRSMNAIVGEWRARMFRYLAVGVPAAALLFLVTLAALRGAAREREALALVREEMARRELVEGQLRQAQKMEAVGQLTGGIAHDFNNLLSGIIGSLDLMQTRLNSGRTEGLERYISAATGSAQRAAALTHRLLAFARRQPLDPKPVDANQLISGMGDLLSRTLTPTHALEIKEGRGLWMTSCDPNQLENAILNLCLNARDAMPEAGRLTIETRNVSFDGVAERAQFGRDGEEFVLIGISDTGTGMPRAVVERAIEPFFTTKPLGQGTGLGLSMVFGFVRQSNGHLKIDSTEGQGTTIKIYLPRHRGVAEPEIAQLSTPLASAGALGGTVLVVEDEPIVRDLIVEVLQDLGCRTLNASDGPAGLTVLQSTERVDLLVTDVGLPGLNGRQLADRGREVRPDLKILFITGYADNVVSPKGFLEPGMEMITKPFSVEALTAKITAMVNSLPTNTS